MTAEELAKAVGVSRATISRVVNGKANVSEETRARVLSAIENLGYAPNSAARSLKLRKSDVIAFLIPWSNRDVSSDPRLGEIIRGVAEAADRFSFNLQVVTDGAHGTPNRRFLRLVSSGSVGGVLTVEHQSFAATEHLVNSRLPCVMIGNPAPQHEDRIPFVTTDNFRGSYKVVEHLVKLGYMRIAYVCGRESSGLGVQKRLEGYKEVLADYGIAYSPHLVVPCDLDREGGYRAALRLLAPADRPDAVACVNDLSALGVLDAARETGLRVPNDLAVVGYNDAEFARNVEPPLTTIRQPVYELGYEAGKMLIKQILGREIRETKMILPAELVVRSSCR